jgi:hypothetical protein
MSRADPSMLDRTGPAAPDVAARNEPGPARQPH